MKTMRKTFWVALAITLLLTAAGEAHAQSGPAPGYDDPYAYTADHAVNESTEAASDPVGFTEEKASEDGVANETEHAAWLACWTADYQADSDAAGACDAYYTPPETAAPDQPAEDAAPGEPGADDAVQDRVDDAEDTVGEIVDAAKDTANEPGSAPEQIRRIVSAVTDFVDRTVFGLLAFVEDVVDFVAEALGVGGGLIGEGTQAAGDAVHGATHGADVVASGVSAVVGDAAGRAGDAAGDAADGVGQAVSEAVDQIKQWITGEPAPDRVDDVPGRSPVDAPDDVGLPDVERTLDDLV